MSIQFLTDLEVSKLRQDVIRAKEGLQDYYLGTASGVKGTEPRLGVPEVDHRVQELFNSVGQASGFITLSTDFTKLKQGEPLPEGYEFSRASKATYWDKDGILREADIDEPRLDYDPVTGEALGLLRERSSTNLAPNSTNLSNWFRTNSTTTQVGSYKGWAIWRVASGSPTNAAARVRAISQIPAGDVTITVLARPSLVNTSIISGAISSTLSVPWAYSTETSSFLSGGAHGYVLPKVVHAVKKLPDGFILLKFTTTIAEQGTELWLFANRSSSGVDNATDFVLIQAESGDSPTSYIPTGTATTTRAADVTTYAKADSSPLFPNGEFSAVIDYDTEEAATPDRGPLNILTDISDNRLSIYNGNTILTAHPQHITPVLGFSTGRNKVAFSITGERKSGSRSGLPVSSVLASVPIVNSFIEINFSFARGIQQCNGHIRSFQLYNNALPDNNLQVLSSL